MDVALKKKLAKEYLLLLGCLAVSFLLFLSLTVFYFITKDELDNINLAIEHREKNKVQFLQDFDKISRRNLDQFSFFPLWNKMEDLLQNDNIKHRWNSKWKENGITNVFVKMGFDNSESLIRFLNENSTTKLKKRKHFINQVSSTYTRWEYSWKFLLVILVLVFPLRYLILSIKYTIKIVKIR